MSLLLKLEAALGKRISEVCDGEFHSSSDNHCAHFVGHIAALGFSYNCREFKGGNGSPANIRVHEIFSECPKVGHWRDADVNSEQLVFVTKTSNVDLHNKTMVNVPQKHIGIFANGFIYHYSNSQNKVVKWTPTKFLNTFEAIYSGTQGLYFGTFPESDLELNIFTNAADVPRGIAFDLNKNGRRWFAAPDGDTSSQFYVGRETSNGNYVGLYMKVSEYYGPKYRAADYLDRYDHWAQLMELTGYCESKNHFNLINTYDSAKFTFGFFQLAAHTPGDNLILLFRRLAQLSEFSEYFPELRIVSGRLHRIDEDGGATDLEVVSATGPGGRRQPQKFMDYLNAKRFQHDRQEVLQSARVIHWANSLNSNRDAQVEVANDILQKKMSGRYAQWYDLDGQSDVICGLVADIHHQGRASKSKVRQALRSSSPEDRLIEINPQYQERISDLRTQLTNMKNSGQLGRKKYDAGLNEFR